MESSTPKRVRSACLVDQSSRERLRFNLSPDNVVLIELLLRLELYLRRYFGLIVDHQSPYCSAAIGTDRHTIILRTVLINYLYDAYLRLLISGRQELVETLCDVGTLTFVWSLARAHKLDTTLQDVADDVHSFSEKLDNLRRISNIDILMPACVAFLEMMAVRRRQPGIAPVQANLSTVVMSLLNNMKTYYDASMERSMFDHSGHYNEAFVPSYRFCDSIFPALNMSRHIGNTMRENIRTLYRYISSVVEDDEVCPCVVIFNLFIRDNYRMYHSKSLRQSSFVSIRCSNGKVVKLSYMIVTNLFPRVNSWFKSINNQLVKKTGKIHIQHLDTFVRLIAQLLPCEGESSGSSNSGGSFVSSNNAGSSKRDVPVKRQSTVAVMSSGRKSGERVTVKSSSATVRVTAVVSSTKKRAANRVTLSALYSSTEDVCILANLFNTRYVSCKHERIERLYEQMRSNDESATLVRVCLDCGRRI